MLPAVARARDDLRYSVRTSGAELPEFSVDYWASRVSGVAGAAQLELG